MDGSYATLPHPTNTRCKQTRLVGKKWGTETRRYLSKGRYSHVFFSLDVKRCYKHEISECNEGIWSLLLFQGITARFVARYYKNKNVDVDGAGVGFIASIAILQLMCCKRRGLYAQVQPLEFPFPDFKKRLDKCTTQHLGTMLARVGIMVLLVSSIRGLSRLGARMCALPADCGAGV
jgi:hypothetical protein